jgi:hypothetical protein
VRAIVVVIAVAAIAWLGVMERDARRYDRGIAAGGRLDDPATIARAEGDMRAARLLNPDRTPDLGLAVILATTGRRSEARALLEGVARDEPDNLSAWDALRFVNGDRDPALARRVTAEIGRLDPLSPPAR